MGSMSASDARGALNRDDARPPAAAPLPILELTGALMKLLIKFHWRCGRIAHRGRSVALSRRAMSRTGVASILSGTFDGIVLSGIVADYLARRLHAHPTLETARNVDPHLDRDPVGFIGRSGARTLPRSRLNRGPGCAFYL